MSSLRSRFATLIQILVVLACHGLSGAADVLPPEDFPVPILWVPDSDIVNLEEATRWRSQGILGAVLGGSLRDVQASASIISTAGFSTNFVLVDSPGVETARAAASSARAMAMSGVAIDLAALRDAETGPFDSGQGSVSIDAGLRWGRSISEAITSEFAGAAVILRLPAPPHCTAAVASVASGISDGLADSSRLHLALPFSTDSGTYLSDVAQFRNVQRVAHTLMDPGSGGPDGTVNALLESASPSFDTMLGALFGSDRYVIVNPGLLTLDTEDETADSAGRLPALLAQLDGWYRAGHTDLAGAQAQVLRGPHGAALALLSGNSEALQLETGASEIHVTDLRTGVARSAPVQNGVATLAPSAGPTLVEGLAVRTWVVPAGLWLDADTSSPGPSFPVRFGWANRTGMSFLGTIETVGPDRTALLPRTQAVNVESGQDFVALGRLQGRTEPCTTLSVQLVLTSPGGSSVTREFPVRIPPTLLWHVAAGSSNAPALTWCDLHGDGAAELLGAAPGALSAWTGSGDVLWCRTAPETWRGAIAGGMDASNRRFLAVPSETGVDVVNAAGDALWQAPLPGGAIVTRTGNLHIAPGDEIVAGSEKGVLGAYLYDGQCMWTRLTDGPVTDIELEDLDDDGRDECLVFANGLVALDGDGNERWRLFGDMGSSSCPLLIADLNGDWQWNIVVGLANGNVAVVEAKSGSLQEMTSVASEPIIGLSCGELLETPGQEVLVATSNRLRCLSAGLTTLWEVPIPMTGPPVVAGSGADARVLAPTHQDGLVCLDGTGTELWRDERAAGPLAGSPLLSAIGEGGTVCVYGAEDGLIRAIQLPWQRHTPDAR